MKVSIYPGLNCIFLPNQHTTMSSALHYTLLILLLAVALSSAAAQAKPKAFLYFIKKDPEALQYSTTLEFSTQVNFVDVVLDLGGEHTWFDCDSYDLPTYKPISCGTTKCNNVKSNGCIGCNLPPKPGCTNNTCGVSSYNPFTNDLYAQGLGEINLFSTETNGLAVGELHKLPKPFPFSCADSDLLRGLSNATKGMTGLANTVTSLHSQWSSKFKLPHKFALCLPSTSELNPGHMFIGGGPYYFPPYTKNIATQLLTTKLVINPVSTAPIYTEGDHSDEYFIDVTSISVDNRPVSVNASLLSIDMNGYGGTKFTTVTPYTKLETSIYKALVGDFKKAASLRKMKRVASVAPFSACFRASSVATSQTGPVVPYIDIGLAGNQHWRFYGANSMVSLKKDVLCLAFVDGGSKPRTSVVIGGHQMENYLIEFDLVSSKLVISTSLLFRNTTCQQFRVL
ncbi:probable aspartic proteinase GIP2 [Daucus carota subsp. sativus]|nr:PREDICTED: basic 7S globulin-like [Daucus carota subsp. sativus]